MKKKEVEEEEEEEVKQRQQQQPEQKINIFFSLFFLKTQQTALFKAEKINSLVFLFQPHWYCRFVSAGSTLSHTYEQEMGVPQGSILYLINFTKFYRNFQRNCYLFVIQGKKTLI